MNMRRGNEKVKQFLCVINSGGNYTTQSQLAAQSGKLMNETHNSEAIFLCQKGKFRKFYLYFFWKMPNVAIERKWLENTQWLEATTSVRTRLNRLN